jgi:hypothetical protein
MAISPDAAASKSESNTSDRPISSARAHAPADVSMSNPFDNSDSFRVSTHPHEREENHRRCRSRKDKGAAGLLVGIEACR